MQGIYVLRNDLCLLQIVSADPEFPKSSEVFHYVGTSHRQLATRFYSYAEAEDAIRRVRTTDPTVRLIVVEF